ncbi:Vacuolar protein-sorting-associated protein 11-like protein, partial [Smittium culicis]
MFSVALNLASQSSEENNQELSAQIHLEQGEYFMDRNEPELAILEYINTIGEIDPSFVIVKLLDIQYLGILITYLENLHSKNAASNDHSMLLLTCYSKHGDESKLIDFLESRTSIDNDPLRDNSYFDVETAIEICLKEGHFLTALTIAEKFNNNHAVLNIIIYKMFDYKRALEFFASVFNSYYNASSSSSRIGVIENLSLVQKFGRILLSNLPSEFTDFLVSLCVNFKVDPTSMKHLFVGYSQYLVMFYENYSILKYGYDILNSPIEDFFEIKDKILKNIDNNSDIDKNDIETTDTPKDNLILIN